MTTSKGKQSKELGWFVTFMANRCEHCILCKNARENPDTTLGRLLNWHGKWCPLWKARQAVYGDKKSNRQMKHDETVLKKKRS
jgi:hypothetical protein